MNIVILDANFLLVPAQYQVDIYQQLRMHLTGTLQLLIVPEVLDELNKKSDTIASTKFKRNVKMAHELLIHQQKQFPQLFMEIPKNNFQNLPVDDYLIELAEKKQQNEENAIYIATNDKELRKKASIKGIRAIYLRQKKILEISQ
ncbi:MAG: type II toxin-antitoxin system VapC family toxin [Promethearchaeota archaeon]